MEEEGFTYCKQNLMYIYMCYRLYGWRACARAAAPPGQPVYYRQLWDARQRRIHPNFRTSVRWLTTEDGRSGARPWVNRWDHKSHLYLAELFLSGCCPPHSRDINKNTHTHTHFYHFFLPFILTMVLKDFPEYKVCEMKIGTVLPEDFLPPHTWKYIPWVYMSLF